ncbi:hypothetical protein HAHE_39990 [Haloferula helveola]|uniref:Uncharacterized protein n=1 Tax=Haloferula helveola TaxID=490095 RepID=A0ABM7RHI0_9BACT|nr:hypothetical protein HAHE_39990 [Haloferula helveola]
MKFLPLVSSVLIVCRIAYGSELPEPASLEKLAKVPASQFTKSINASESPDKRFVAAVGSPDGAAPKWVKTHHGPKDVSYVLESVEGHCRNYLVDMKTDRVTAILEAEHFGTGTQYNHESALHAWSANARWLIEIQSWKWATGPCSLHRINEAGGIVASYDLMTTAREAVAAELAKKGINSAEDYAVSVPSAEVSDGGSITLEVTGEVPKDPDTPFVSLSVRGAATLGANKDLSVKITGSKPME